MRILFYALSQIIRKQDKITEVEDFSSEIRIVGFLERTNIWKFLFSPY